MKQATTPVACASLEQVYLIERDTALLCRILGLYAARGIDVLRADYAYAAQNVMTLKVSAAGASADAADTLRVLVEKARSLVGVLAAAEPDPPAAARGRQTAFHRAALAIGSP